MKIVCIGIFSAVASYTISAVSHRLALKKNLFDARIRQPSMTKAEMMEWAEKLTENFLNPYRTEKNSSLQDCSGFFERAIPVAFKSRSVLYGLSITSKTESRIL